MAFDSQRGVIVLFGAGTDPGEVWEYKVNNLGNGEGCTAATAQNCASGFCVGWRLLLNRSLVPGPANPAVSPATKAPAPQRPRAPKFLVAAPGQAVRRWRQLQRKERHSLFQRECLRFWLLRGRCVLRERVRRNLPSSAIRAGQAGKCSAYAAAAIHRKECGLGKRALSLDLQRRWRLRLSAKRNSLRDL